jgi:hypothetical protein
MTRIPGFDEAVADFRRFLGEHGYSGTLWWAFREDLWRRSHHSFVVRTPPHPSSQALAKAVFDQGRSKGLIEVAAVARLPTGLVTTVWYPKYPSEEVQGWSCGMKLSIYTPLPSALPVPRSLWPVVRMLPPYRRYQARECFIGTRRWAAEQGIGPDGHAPR